MGKGDSNGASAVPIKVETVAENDEENTDNNDKDHAMKSEEEETMESLLASFGDNGENDDFVTAEEREEAAALERRRKRKRRLESLEASAATLKPAVKPAIKIESTASTAIQIKKEESTPNRKEADAFDPKLSASHGKAIKAESTSTSLEEKELNDKGDISDNDNDDSDSDSDDSDMFGSPSSEDRARKKEKKREKNKSTNNNHKSSDSSGANGPNESKPNSRQDGFDDSDGYYKASIGETMELEVLGSQHQTDHENENEAWTLKLRVLGVIGKGVFSSVLKCSTTSTTTTTNTAATGTPTNSSHDSGIPATISLPSGYSTNEKQQQQQKLPSEVAIKCIRSNETMAKAALDEMKFLIRLRDSPGIVPLLLPAPQHTSNSTTNNNNNNPNYIPPPIDFRGHTILVFPYLPYNLRDVLQKFGKGVGLSLGAVQNYYKQLLSAAIHLQKQGIIHADIKPDNILVSADFSRVLVADFGSAFESRAVLEDEGGVGQSTTHNNNNEAVTPYLVSRFYRAPEIILGLQPLTYAIDLWSLAVTAGELFLGRVMLQGANNNNMLYAMMELLGPFSARIIKSHLLQTKKHPLQAHFSQVQSNFVFRKETVDLVLGRPVHKEVSLASNDSANGNAFKPTLQSKLLRAKSPKDTRTEILLFADLLTKCLLLDPSKRISVRAALKHKFFAQKQQ